MRIILSPAKKMNIQTDLAAAKGVPVFLEQAETIADWLQLQSVQELKALWKCNDKILEQNVERLQQMDLKKGSTPAVLSYEGLAYQYLAPAVLEGRQLDYLQENLRILSGFYGVLKPMDGIVPYRLEMQTKAKIEGSGNLYEFWGDRIYHEVRDDSRVIINLASKEYSRCVEKYLQKEDRFITITFCEQSGGKLVTKGTYAKMARGEMVRFMAEYQIKEPEELRKFDRLGYVFREDLSSGKELIFERTEK